MRDTFVVAWKELKEYVAFAESKRGLAVQFLIFIGWLGVLMPLQQPDLAKTPWLTVFLPLIVTGGVVADSFAGERDRKTLETLLATRLPDRSIYAGKMLAAVTYAWTMTVLVSAVSIVVINVAGTPYLPSPGGILARVVAAALAAALVANIGVYISLRAKTVREAQQTLSLVFVLAPISLTFILPAAIRYMPPELRSGLLHILESTNPSVVGAVFMAALAALDVVLVTTGIRRFRRSRLIL
ncbi:MAG: ABC transporter permease [Ignavibacteriales bacterium]